MHFNFRANQKAFSGLIYCFGKAADVLYQDLVSWIKILLNSYQRLVKMKGIKY